MDSQNEDLQGPDQNSVVRTPGGQISIFAGGVDINTLLSKAVDLANVEAIERLTALWERERARVAEDAYNHDMSCLQNECPIIKKTRSVFNGDKVMYKFAPLEEIKRQTKDLIYHYGFSYDVNTEFSEGQVKVIFTVTHRDGHKKEFAMQGPDLSQNKLMNALQARAGSISFITRKLYCGAFGIVTADDDIDGRVFFEDLPENTGNVQDLPKSSGKKKFSFSDAPEENRPIYKSIMAILNQKEGGVFLFNDIERKEIKSNADALLMQTEGLAKYYKAVHERSQQKRTRLKNAG